MISLTTKTENLVLVDIKRFSDLADLRKEVFKKSLLSTISGIITEALSFDTVLPANVNEIIREVSGSINDSYNIGEESTLSFFKFRINPNKMDIGRKKIISKKYTGGGYDIDTRGEEMITYNYTGSTGSLVPQDIMLKLAEAIRRFTGDVSAFPGMGIFTGVIGNRIKSLVGNPKLSTAYLKLLLLEEFWKKNNDEIMVIWEDNCYVGKLINFNYSFDANTPYMINYNFSIEVYPEFKYNLYTGWITEVDFSDIKKRFVFKVKEVEEVVADSDKGIVITQFKEKNIVTQGGIDYTFGDSRGGVIGNEIQGGGNNYWYESQGNLLYNKDRLSFLKNNTKSMSVLDLSPRAMAEYYRKNSPGIDIFEDYKDLDKKPDSEKVDAKKQEFLKKNDYNISEIKTELLNGKMIDYVFGKADEQKNKKFYILVDDKGEYYFGTTN